MKRIFVAILAAVALGGCAATYSGMSADQIAASAKAKDANVVCVVGAGPWGKVVTTYVNVDKSVIDVGGIHVADGCDVQFVNQKRGIPVTQ